jgi:hypothetical protein
MTANKKNQISRKQCYFVFIAQKIHFVAFNTIVIDLVFYGLRTLGQTRGLSFMDITATLVLLFLVTFDLCEIWHLTSSAVILKDQFDVLNRGHNPNSIHPKKDDSELSIIVEKSKISQDRKNTFTQRTP